MEIIRNIPQGSDLWFELRAKRLTASHATAIGTNGKGLETYVKNKMAEYFSSAERDNYTNKDLERGNTLEPEACALYAWEQSRSIEVVSFVIYNDYVGVSPDRFADADGLLEVKCPNDKNYFALLLDGKIESKYIWQTQMQMLVCQKEWCDLAFYNPNFEEKFYIKRIEPDQKKFDKLLEGFKSGEEMIKQIENKIK